MHCNQKKINIRNCLDVKIWIRILQEAIRSSGHFTYSTNLTPISNKSFDFSLRGCVNRILCQSYTFFNWACARQGRFCVVPHVIDHLHPPFVSWSVFAFNWYSKRKEVIIKPKLSYWGMPLVVSKQEFVLSFSIFWQLFIRNAWLIRTP